MALTVKAFQQYAENFLAELKIRFFDGQVTNLSKKTFHA